MLVGHIDESGSDETKLFTLSCIVTAGGLWWHFENAWLKWLDKTNLASRKQGRKELRRYHSTDCASSHNDFEGWIEEERRTFLRGLLNVFRCHNAAIIFYTVDLGHVTEIMPGIRNKSKEIAYIWFLQKIMAWIGDRILDDTKYAGWDISLIHDRTTGFDAVLADAFNAMKDDAGFKHRNRFTTITPMCWEDCVPLQAADFIAYENFKIIERNRAGRLRRKVMDLLLDLQSIGGSGVEIPRQGVKDFDENLTVESRRKLYEMARIPRPTNQGIITNAEFHR